ncbi:Ig-like domain-containing protein [Psychrobacter sp. M9-54-1]|uniref:Ig-like domain-containing protein n=1 Tax=Psychrobacter sp. M9-54-1 TaxID=2782386 RepID=UPI00190A1716|nr:Ig-like domain-containing protein [Psychrobacter sp. M9-54-1]MBK3392722.1 Ig-like domain-containing protein [Psychrobacter sp. M9-54-1]
MSYSSLPLTSKLFQLTSLTCALALAGCGGGDGTDVIAPTPDLGVQPGTGGNNGGGDNNGGGEQTPDIEPDFFIQKLSTAPTIIELSDEQTSFNVTVKAVEKISGGAMVGKAVTLKVVNSENNGITIEGQSTQTTDSDGNAVYALKLNPQAVADKDKLIANGFTLVATANKADGTAVAPQELKVSVNKKGSGDGTQVIVSKLSVKPSIKTSSVSNSVLNPFGDTGVFSVELKDEKGTLTPNVTVGLGIIPLEGVSISPASQETDSKGIVNFNIKIDENLSESARQNLLKGITYTLNVREKNGASKSVTNSLKVGLPITDYKIRVAGNSNKLSAYGDTQNLTITAAAISAAVSTKIEGAKVAFKLNNAPKGVSLSSNQLTLDNSGQAIVTLSIEPGLSDAERKALAENGISYTATLSEPNHSVTAQTFESSVEIPLAKNIVSFEGSDKKQISSSGGSAVISFRVNNQNGGAVANQLVTAALPTELTSKGLLTIDGSTEQTTNDKGVVSYTVRVPAGLNEAQKAVLEKASNFALAVKAVEASGASSVASSSSIAIGSEIGQSDITLTAQSIPATVNILESQFKLQVAAKRKDGSAADGRTVKLVLNEGSSNGVTIQGNQRTTDGSGIAEFNIGISQSLTQAQRDQLIKTGIGYTAIVTDQDGTQSKITQNIKVEQPLSAIQFASIETPTISELGGKGTIGVKLSTKDKQSPVAGQAVAIQLGKVALDYGVTIDAESAVTDFNGETTFIVSIPNTLTAEERTKLKLTGINYQLSYVEKGITYSEINTVNITTPKVDLSILNATNNIDNKAGYILNNVGSNITIQAQLNNQSTDEQITSQPVKLIFENKSLASLLIVNEQNGSSNIIATTDENGLVNFNVVVPGNLTDVQKEMLSKEVLTATLTETLTGNQQQVKIKVQSMAAAISLIAKQTNPLNLNGGETQIEVTVADKSVEPKVVAGQKVFLALPAAIASQGVTLVSGSSQTTDNSGKAVFTVAVPNNLTDAQKAEIAKNANSFSIGLSAADANGNIVTQASSVATVTPDPNGTKESISIGANKVVNTKGDTFKVFVRLENKDGAIANRAVRLNVDDPIKTGVSISNGTVNTNSDGVATFDLRLEAGANVNQAILKAGIRLTATTTTAENVKLVQNYIVAVDNATIDSYQLIASSDKSTLNTGGDQTNATFRVTDSNGGILAGVPVQFSIENLEASGAALTTPSMLTTDANGQIDVGVILAANSINSRLNHSVVINAKIVTPQYDADGKVSMQVREEKSLSLSAVGTEITLTASETKLKDRGLTTISTMLVDGAGRAIANAGMELVGENGNIIATTATAITDADGKASFDVSEDTLSFDSNGNLRVYARAFGENKINNQRSLNSIDLVKVSQAGISFIDVKNVYDVNTPQTINIQIRRDTAAQAEELIDKQVEVQTTIGTFADSNDVIVTKPITAANINGNIVTIPVTLTSELAGITALQVTVLGETLPNGEPRYRATVDARFRATTPAKMLFQAVKSVITPGSSTEIVATVKDKNDVPVEGQTVVFSRASDSSAGRLSAATAVTNSRGEARVVYQANASSPIGGVIINARLLQDNGNIGSKTTNITVSKEAVYTTLAFSNKLSSDDIYYTVRGSISVMDGSGRAVANQEVSIKSYATEYAQGVYCLLDSTTTYQAADIDELDEFGNVIKTTTPEPKVFSEKTPVPLKSDWYPTEDANYNYTLDQDSDPILNEDKNSSGKLEAINPVTILGNKVSEDGYSFITDDEGRADFEIRYPLRYSNWVKVRFDASTFVNGSENTQSINYQLPTSVDDLIINDTTLITPWIGNASPFGTGGATCTNSLSVTINENTPRTRVTLSPYSPNYSVTIDGQGTSNAPSAGFNTYIIDFNKAYELGSTVTVNNNGFGFSKVIKVE